jgi:hypothetical protein
MKDCRMAQPVIADDALVTLEDEFGGGLDELGRIRISPTDVSQFRRCLWGWLMAEKADIPLGLFERLQ